MARKVADSPLIQARAYKQDRMCHLGLSLIDFKVDLQDVLRYLGSQTIVDNSVKMV